MIHSLGIGGNLMILKIIISIVILISSSLIGYLISLKYTMRVKQLNYFQSTLNSLENEIIYYATPLPLALKKIGQKSDKSISKIFLDTWMYLNSRKGYRIEESWTMSLKNNKYFTVLTKEDIEVLSELGKELGIGSKETQKKHFEFVRYLINEQKEMAIREQDKNSKMYNRLGFLIGLSIVIILI